MDEQVSITDITDPVQAQTLDQALSAFLRIEADDRALLTRHRALLTGDAECFGRAFYDYLYSFPQTAKVLHDFEAAGGRISDLVAQQTSHLRDLLNEEPTPPLRLLHVGRVHFARHIEPAWVMGAYRLYLDHLRETIHGADLPVAETNALHAVLSKIVLRDMGLLLEGYWQSAVQRLEAQKQTMETLQSQVACLLENLPQVLWSVDVQNASLLYISPGARDLCPFEITLPIPCLGWTLEDDRPRVVAAWEAALAGEQQEVESRIRRSDGQVRWFRRTFHPVKDADGRVVRIDGLMEDTSDNRATLDRLEQLATRDELTGLANRSAWRAHVEHALNAARRKGSQAVVMLLDLNHFKLINDTLGHSAGDEILRQTATRLKEVLRSGDILARLGGDEFAILLPEVNAGMTAAARAVEKIERSFHLPYHYEFKPLKVGASVGVALYPDHGEDPEALLRRADIAMYRAKRAGLGHAFFEPDQSIEQETQDVLLGLHRALQHSEFQMYFQPIYELGSGRMHAAEALIRWRHKDGRLALPHEFLPLAEQTGLIETLTDWIVHSSLNACRHWEDECGVVLPVTINIPARWLHADDLVPRLDAALRLAELGPERLYLEITEDELMTDTEQMRTNLEGLATLGVRVALDDFGTGYSSLAYLKRLPLKQLKIDRSFVTQLATDPQDEAIVRAIIDLGHSLGLDVVAEGVESAAQLARLRALGCDLVQGFALCRPLPPNEFDAWLRRPVAQLTRPIEGSI